MKLTITTFAVTACIIGLCAGCAGPQARPTEQVQPAGTTKDSVLDGPSRERANRLFEEGTRLIAHNPKEALALFSQVVQAAPERWEVHYNMGLAQMRLNEGTRAEESFEKALKFNAPKTKVYNALAAVYSGAGNKTKALETLKKSLDTEESAETLLGMANLYQDLGQNDNAMKFYRRAEALDPSSRAVHHNRGALLYKMGEYKGAVDEFNKALEKNGADVRLLTANAQALFKTGDYEGAVKAFQKITAAAPDDPATYLSMGIIYEIYLGNWEKALENFTTYIQKGGPKAKEVEAWVEVVRNKAKPKEGG